MASGVRSLALAFLILALSAGAGQAAVFTVTTSNDGLDVAPGDGICATFSGACTIRAAVQEANALAGADTVVVPEGHYGLGLAGGKDDVAATGDLDITSAVTMTGAGAAITEIQQGTTDRLFDVRPGGSLALSDLQLTDGTLSDTSIDDPGNGAGIRSFGTLAVSRVWFSLMTDNVAALRNGGGVAVDGGTAIVRDSLFTDMLVALGSGQAAVVSAGTLTLENVTAVDNTANPTGGVFATVGGSLIVRGATVVGNAASAIDRETAGTADVSFLLASGPGLPCTSPGSDAVHLGPGNVFDVAAPECTGAGDTAPRLYGAGGPKLGGLQAVGLLPPVEVPMLGSPAIDTGAACGTLTTDARGGARPQGGSCDAGAVEVGSLSDVQVSGAGPSTAQSTDAVTDTFVVTNAGSDPSRAVTVTIATAGPGTLFGLATSQGICALSQRNCVLGDLAAGQTVIVRTDLRAGGRGTLQATLRAKHLTLERVTTNDLATIKTAIKPDTTKPVLVQSAATLHVGSKRTASVRFTCPATERTCTGTIKPTLRGKHLRTVRVKLVGGRGVTVKVALDATARRLIRHGSRLKATFAVNVVDAAGNRFRATLRTTIRK